MRLERLGLAALGRAREPWRQGGEGQVELDQEEQLRLPTGTVPRQTQETGVAQLLGLETELVADLGLDGDEGIGASADPQMQRGIDVAAARIEHSGAVEHAAAAPH